MRLLKVVLIVVLLSQNLLFAQREIAGLVADETGLPLIGVSIFIKHLNSGTTTEIDGHYQLSIPDQAQFLIFSYTGFASREIEIGTDTILNITLRESAVFLEEIIVTGVAIGTPTTKVGFNIAKVNEQQLKQAPGVNAATALQGKVPGVQITTATGVPGGNSSILIRGTKNLFGFQSAPLIIVDGIQLQEPSNLSDINSEDIASIEVVKGAAATSLYGSRAGNGVINIITKRGSEQEGVTDITYRTELGKSSLVKQLDLATHHANLVNADGSVDFSKTDEDHIADNEYPQLFDQQGLFFDPGSFQTNTLSIGSRNRSTNYFFSLNQTKQSGTIPLLKGYARQSTRINIDHKISNVLKLTVSSYYAQSNNDQPSFLGGSNSPFFKLLILPPNVNLNEPNEEDGSPYNWDVALPAGSFESNPLYQIDQQEAKEAVQRYAGSFGLSIRPIPALVLEGNYSIDRRNRSFEYFIDKGYLENPSLADGYFYRANGIRTYQTATGKITFNKTLKHLGLTTQGAVIYEDDENMFFDIDAFDFRFKGIRSLNNSGVSGNPPVNRTRRSSNDFEIKTLNYYLTANLDWKDKLIIDGLVRWDGSSLFGPNNRWNTFYRSSVAYRLSEDISLPNVQELKLRAAYGTAGNRPRFDYRFETLTPDGTKNTLGNEALKSSLTKEAEFGLDARISDRFSLTLNYAHAITSDLFYNVPLPAASGGFQRQWQNINSKIVTKSFEIALGADLIQKKDIGLSLNFTFDKIRQELTKFDFPDFRDYIFLLRAGVAPGTMYMNTFARSVNDLPAFQREGKRFVKNEEGWLVDADKWRTIDERPIMIRDEEDNTLFTVGNSLPDFNLGFSLNAHWKNIHLYTLFHWKQGGKIYNLTKQWIFRDLRHGDIDQSHKPEVEKKPIEYYATFYDANQANNYFLEEGSFLKLRELALSYVINTKSWAKLGKIIKGGKVSLIGRNLFTVTKYSGYDPEVAWFDETFDANISPVDGYGYPNFRTITGSFEIKF